MALFTEQDIRARYARERGVRTRYFSARDVLNEGRVTDSTKTYDIFLSHSSKDMELIAGLKLILNDLGYTVYVDWNDNELDPNNVTPRTAEVLRERMACCRSLVYAFSENASNSKWMPWELGYFDALNKSRVAVLPITTTAKYSFKGSEFVGLYYFIQIDTIKGQNKKAIWVYDKDNKYVIFSSWLQGVNPLYK